jgi:hypothetical protein
VIEQRRLASHSAAIAALVRSRPSGVAFAAADQTPHDELLAACAVAGVLGLDPLPRHV